MGCPAVVQLHVGFPVSEHADVEQSIVIIMFTLCLKQPETQCKRKL